MSDVAEEMLLDFLDAVEAGIASAKERYKKRKQINACDFSYDINKIRWKQAAGPSGPYESSEDLDSPDWRQLLQDLMCHDGRLSKDGYFLWLFNNGSSMIGRKRKRGSVFNGS
jgi:hypothetical protein